MGRIELNEDVKPEPGRIGSITDYPEAAARDKGDIEVALTRLVGLIDRVENASTLLDVRLETVLKPKYPRESKGESDVPEMAPLASRLMTYCEQLEAVVDRLNYIEMRISL